MDSITKKFQEHYRSTITKYGPNFKGVDWNNKKNTELRYRSMLEIFANHFKKKPSLLDIGCGYGGLLQEIKKRKIILNYTGLDVVPEMITLAQKKHPSSKFINKDIFSLSSKKQYDFVIANGLFTQKLKATNKDMEKFMFRLINKMWSLSKEGIAFNILTSQVDFKNPGNFYYDPAVLINKTKKMTRFFKINHDYPIFEYTFYLYKKPITK